MNYFAKNIEFLREQNNLSKSDMLDRLSIPRTTWISYEKNGTEPNIDRILHIAEYFGVDVSKLLTSDLSKGKVITKEDDAENNEKGKVNGKPNGKVIAKKYPTGAQLPGILMDSGAAPYSSKKQKGSPAVIKEMMLTYLTQQIESMEELKARIEAL